MLAASGPAETDGTTTNLEGRVSTRRPQDHAAGHRPRRLDARRRAGPPARRRPRRRVGRRRSSTRSPRSRPSHVGLTVDAIHGARDGVVVGATGAEPRRRPGRCADRRPASSPTPAEAARRRRGGRRRSRSSRPPRPRPPRPRPTPRPPTDADPAPPPPGRAGARRCSAFTAPADRRLAGRRRLLAAPRRQPQALRPRHRRPALARARRPHRRHGAAPAPARLRPPRRRPPARVVTRHVVEGLGHARRCSPTTASAAGAAVVTLNQPGATVGALIDATAPRHRDPGGEAVTLDARRSIRSSPATSASTRSSSSSSRSSSRSRCCSCRCCFMIWFERKVHADMSNRLGPNRAGPFGHPPDARRRHQVLLQGGPAARPRRPARVHPGAVPVARPRLPRVLGRSRSAASSPTSSRAPSRSSATTPTCSSPTRPSACCSSSPARSIAVYGVMLAGWSSGSKYPLLGSVRASAQMVSYEAALGLSVVAVVLLAGSLSTHDIVMTQAGEGCVGVVPRWNVIVTGVVPFVIFLIAGTAELNRPPFDLVEAEQELVGGFHTEYSLDPLRAVLPRRVHEHRDDVGDHRHAVPRRPGRPDLLRARLDLGPGVVPRQALRSSSSCSCGSGPRCPRFRYDQLMDLGWKVLIPLSLGWLLLLPASTSPATRTGTPASSWPSASPPSSSSYLLLTAAMRTAPARAAS